MKNSSSIAKDGHLLSYFELFKENPSYLILGKGPGSYFFTKGFNSCVTNTELSYFELIRMFGLPFTVILVLLYLYPFYYLIGNINFYSFSVATGYLAYLFIAGTNPLLIGPTGFIAFWLTSNFLANSKKKIGVSS